MKLSQLLPANWFRQLAQYYMHTQQLRDFLDESRNSMPRRVRVPLFASFIRVGNASEDLRNSPARRDEVLRLASNLRDETGDMMSWIDRRYKVKM